MDAVPESAKRDGQACPRCQAAHQACDRFCRNCGLELRDDAGAIEAYLARILPERIDSALRSRFKDQKVVEVEVSEKVAERAMGWLKTLAFFLGIPALILGAILSFLGIKTYSDIEKASQKATEFERVVSGAEQKFEGVQKRVDSLDVTLKNAQARIDNQLAQLEGQQQSLQAQVKSIENRLRFCPSKGLSSALRESLQGQLSKFIVHLERVGFRELDEQVLVCIYSKDDPLEKYKDMSDVRNAFYNPADRTIYIHADLSSVASVALREYTHHALSKAAPRIMSIDEAREIESGLADYFAASFLGEPGIGDTLGPLFGLNTSYLRTLANDLKYAAVRSDPHSRGEVWSAALWRCRTQLGRDAVDKISLQAWSGLADQAAKPDIAKKFGAFLIAQERTAAGQVCLMQQLAQRGLPH
jgi:hypothetical protein